jgi:hypothetical protein
MRWGGCSTTLALIAERAALVDLLRSAADIPAGGEPLVARSTARSKVAATRQDRGSSRPTSSPTTFGSRWSWSARRRTSTAAWSVRRARGAVARRAIGLSE